MPYFGPIAAFRADRSISPVIILGNINEGFPIFFADLSDNGETSKRLDYVPRFPKWSTDRNLFYANGESKLNETARSYRMLAREANSIPGFTFLWFTGRQGRKKANDNLKVTFDETEHICNIEELD